MVYLRVAESDEAVMQKKLFYQKNPNEKQNYPPTSELENGYYSVSRLLGQALIESDNAAAVALLQVREKEFNELYATLRLPAKPVKLDDYMSPREVSRIFRSLYSSTYLLDSYSEQALQFLVETHFNDGLTQGVPEEIEIANKFGEHTVYYANNKESPDYELHDCGIVYYPKKPYFICVMTKGKNLESLENIIKEISSKTFEFVKEAEF